MARQVPTVETTEVPHPQLGSIKVSRHGDRIDWEPSPGNEFACANFFEGGVCPICSHPASSHCEPYQPSPGQLHSRCNEDHVETVNGKPVVGRCGTCVRLFSTG